MFHRPFYCPYFLVACWVAVVFESPVIFLRRLFFLALLNASVGCHRAAEPAVKPEAEPAQSAAQGRLDAQQGAGSVWVADKPGQPGRLFLCGTIHILREKDYPLSPGYEAAYNHSDALVFELPPAAGSDPAMTQRMRELGACPAGTTLESEVTPETWAAVKKWGQAHGVEPANLNRMRPWFVALLVTSVEYAGLGAQPDKGVDQHFEKRAERDKKPGSGLETVEFQLQLFAKLTADQQKNMLEQTLAEISTLPQEYEKMLAAWKNGELEALHDMMFREAERYPELMDLFLKNRNLAWIDRLDEMLKKGQKVMVLVGAGHLAAKEGLVQLLKDRGYRVRHHREVEDL